MVIIWIKWGDRKLFSGGEQAGIILSVLLPLWSVAPSLPSKVNTSLNEQPAA